MMSRTYTLLFTSLALILFTQCKPEPKKQENTIIIHRTSDANDLNPVTCKDVLSNYIAMQLFQSLLGHDFKTNELIGIVAAERPTIDTLENGNLKLNYKIREGAKFDDGKEILAENILFSLKAHLCPGVNSSSTQFFKFISDFIISETNPKDFSIICRIIGPETEYFSGAFFLLDSRIYDPENILAQYTLDELINVDPSNDSNITAFTEHFNGEMLRENIELIKGTGAYEFKERKKGESITLIRKKNWWGNKYSHSNTFFAAKAEKIKYEIIPDQNTALLALKKGDIDLSASLITSAYIKLKNETPTAYQFVEPNQNGFHSLGFNLAHPLLSQLTIRQAIAYLSPKVEMLKQVHHNLGELTAYPYTANHLKELSLDDNNYAFDASLAAEILKNDGWSDSNENGILDKTINGELRDLELSYAYNSTNNQWKACGLILKQEAEKIGISIKLEPYDWNTYKQKKRAGELEIFYQDLISKGAAPNFNRIFHSQNIGRSNYTNYQSPIADSLIEALEAEQNPKANQRLTVELLEQLNQDLPCLPLWTLRNTLVVQKELKGVYPSQQRPYYWAPDFYKE